MLSLFFAIADFLVFFLQWMNGPGPGGDFFSLSLDGGNGTKGFAHAQVVHQHAVVQIHFQITGSQRVQGLILIVLAFKNGFTEFGGLFLVRGTVGTLQAIGDVGDLLEKYSMSMGMLIVIPGLVSTLMPSLIGILADLWDIRRGMMAIFALIILLLAVTMVNLRQKH